MTPEIGQDEGMNRCATHWCLIKERNCSQTNPSNGGLPRAGWISATLPYEMTYSNAHTGVIGEVEEQFTLCIDEANDRLASALPRPRH
jgi:hypothetical protein